MTDSTIPTLTKKEMQELDFISSMNVSTGEIASLTGLHRNSVRTKLEKLEIKPVETRGNKTLYVFGEAIPALIGDARKVSPSDRRNLAIAHKAEIETRKLLQKNIPKPELPPAVGAFFSGYREIIKDFDMPEDLRERLLDTLDKGKEDVENFAVAKSLSA